MSENREITREDARRIGDRIGMDWQKDDLEEVRRGLDVDSEHGSHDPQTDVPHADPALPGKIALAYLKESPDDDTRLEKLEAQAEKDWGNAEHAE